MSLPSKAKEMNLHMVLFTPEGMDLPVDYQERYMQLADYTEHFFLTWMMHWGYDCETALKIKRDTSGAPHIIVVRGKHKADFPAYQTLEGVRSEIEESLKEMHGIEFRKGDVIWGLNYPKIRRGSRGGGNAMTGGVAFANYIDVAGGIEPKGEMAMKGVHQDILLKSLIHELTHALGIGHIGPREGDNLGNSLMGPVNKAYQKLYPDDERVYLSEASASMLYRHPLFGGNGQCLEEIPTLETSDIKMTYNAGRKVMIVSGKVASNEGIHHVVVLDESMADKSAYWHKAYVGVVDDEGNFTCKVTELIEGEGTLKLVFCFDNGAITGNGKALGISKGGIGQKYTFDGNAFR